MAKLLQRIPEPALRLLNGEDRQLAYSDFVNGRLNASIVYQARGTGPYFLQAGAYDDAFTGTYRIDVSAGRLDLTLPDVSYAVGSDVSAGELRNDLDVDARSDRRVSVSVSAGFVALGS